jgi:hypothetical protein
MRDHSARAHQGPDDRQKFERAGTASQPDGFKSREIQR